jgi:hypothetical protein
MRGLLQSSRADTISTIFVLLYLLEADTQRVAKSPLSDVECWASQAHPIAIVSVDRIRMDPLGGILALDHVLRVSVRDVYRRLGQKKRVTDMILTFATLPRRFVRVTFWKVLRTT